LISVADWPLLIGRFSLLTLAIGLFGGACFPLYAPWTPPGRQPASLRVAAPAAAAAAGLIWLLSLWAQTPGRPSLLQFCLTTVWGGALCVAIALCLVLVAMAFTPPRSPRVRAYVTGALLVSLAFVGHAATIGGIAGGVRVAVMALHLLFAGVWLGGLLPLVIALRTPGAETEGLLRAFGRMAIGCVAVLATTGLVIAAVVVSLAGGPPGPPYLITFGVKLALVLCLGVVAGVNRWALTPLSARNPSAAARALWWTLGVEQLLALALLVTVAQLGLLDPAAF
jgi:putative copper resistance protein D